MKGFKTALIAILLFASNAEAQSSVTIRETGKPTRVIKVPKRPSYNFRYFYTYRCGCRRSFSVQWNYAKRSRVRVTR